MQKLKTTYTCYSLTFPNDRKSISGTSDILKYYSENARVQVASVNVCGKGNLQVH